MEHPHVNNDDSSVDSEESTQLIFDSIDCADDMLADSMRLHDSSRRLWFSQDFLGWIFCNCNSISVRGGSGDEYLAGLGSLHRSLTASLTLSSLAICNFISLTFEFIGECS